MRTTVDIPDETYRKIKILASQRGTTLRQLVLDGLSVVARSAPAGKKKRFEVPILPSTRTDKIDLDNEAIYDIIGFP
jgi:hypothetical protein